MVLLQMGIEGSVAISLVVRGNVVSEAVITAQRPLVAQKLLAGKQAHEVTDLVAMVYRLCARAQAFAASLALEQALGVQATAATQSVRQQLLRMELMREHLWRILLDWPVLMGASAQHQLMKQVLAFDQAWVSLLDTDKQALQCNADISPATKIKTEKISLLCGAFLQEHVFYMPAKTFYMCHDVDQLLLWAKYTQTDAARLIQWIIDNNYAQAGNVDAHGLPDLEEARVHKILASNDAESFMLQPHIDGQAYESTPFSRQRHHPLMRALTQRFGVGLLTRYMAVLLEVAATHTELASDAPHANKQLENQPSHKPDQGMGVVEAARGRLIHRVVLQDGAVQSYQIVAPTEWNFHPQGVLKKALLQLQGNAQSIEQQALLLIHAMDPCVKFSLQVKSYA